MKSALSAQPTLAALALALVLPSMMCLGACDKSVAIGNQAVDAQGDTTSDTANATGGTGGMLTGGAGGGGAMATGGISGSGGARASGGAQGSGGVASTGGAQASGGVQGSGGARASGGVQGSGGALASGGVQGSGGSAIPDAASDTATGCPAQIPISSTACSGSLTCPYGQTTCCGQTYPAWYCLCQNGTFSCNQAGPCNSTCPGDAGSTQDVALDSPLDGNTGVDASSTGGACGGSGDPSCSAGAYCAWSDKRCGALMHGTCATTPSATCTALATPVCGCDGNNYPSDCDAAKAGTDVSTSASCPSPTGMFRCGWSYCQHGTEYCHGVMGGAVGASPSYDCQALPAACGTTPSCTCVTSTTATLCSQSNDGDVTVLLAAP